MIAITRAPRLLVKLPAAPPRATFSFGAKVLDVAFSRLFQSIRPPGAGIGAAPPPEWHTMATGEAAAEVNVWDLCHHITRHGFGIAGLPPAHFAEPDFEQSWLPGSAVHHALAAARSGDQPAPPDSRLPQGPDCNWFLDPSHSQLEAARTAVGQPENRVRIAHCDTGYDPHHQALPRFLRRDLQRNFVDDRYPADATDRTSGILTNLGHGTGTMSLLALGGATFLDVVPIRVANSVVLFQNSAIARAFDYSHGLFGDPATRVHVVTMSMGGLASQVWADAVNALYDLGVFLVTAAGNNFGNLPTRNIVFPARFHRVVAACGVMADGAPYADLPLNIMAGNYGPPAKMVTAISGFTPNTPWARLGSGSIVDRDGRGTSAATPQVAAAAALWIQANHAAWQAYSQGWMRVEAARKALFDTARLDSPELAHRLGHGAIHANSALSQSPAAESSLRPQKPDTAAFPFLRVISGLGIADAPPDPHSRMLELEALQLTQRSRELEQLLPDPGDVANLSPADRRRIVAALHEAPGASRALRAVLEPSAATVVAVKPSLPSPALDQNRIQLAMNPPLPPPPSRKLRVFAFDPLFSQRTDFLQINQTTLEIPWEDLQPGPVGEYLEVIDVDPATGCSYAPVDLNHVSALSQHGFPPSESNPAFHQQMVYAVAMKTIRHFERALGRVALWSPRFRKYRQNGQPHIECHYVRRLRIYPHALREANSFYSPAKKALLLGYFPASATNPGENLPGGAIFSSLSHDIIAHETTHALLDGLHRYFGEPSNEDVLAFHEAFADIVALFQHFTVPEALRDAIARWRGDLSQNSILSGLALQFGQGMGQHQALRSAVGLPPTPEDYRQASEPHQRGAVLVAAVYDAFEDVYRRRSADLIRLATSGTGNLQPGEISHDLVNRLAREAAKTAGHILNICIRALDYCPPVDLRFGEYLRALITADRDLVPEDRWGYRAAFIQGFRRRGIYPENVRNLSSESLCWETPETAFSLEGMLSGLQIGWDLHGNRRAAFDASRSNGRHVRDWILQDPAIRDSHTESLGFYRRRTDLTVDGRPGKLRNFEVHSVRPVHRTGPDGQPHTDLVVEIAQTWLPAGGTAKFRGGCTLIVDLEKRALRYVVRKRVGHPGRVHLQEQFRMRASEDSLRANYFGDGPANREPFAMIHRLMQEA